MFHDSPERAKVVPARLEHHNEETAAQPSEPTLLPKLRIYIAGFPFLAGATPLPKVTDLYCRLPFPT